MAWTDACKIEACAQIDRRREEMGLRAALRHLSRESGIPYGTLKRWYYPDSVPKNGNTKKDTDPSCILHTGDPEAYTPAQYIEAAREVMGSIDLDPASNEKAQEVVKAKVYYTKEDDGLDKPWDGNIFLNPPYSHPEVKYFVDKLLAELKPGQQAILLTNNNTDTNFFHDAVRQAAVVCFTKGRINFLKPDGSVSSPTNGQVFYYFGDNKDDFIRVFSQFGIMMGVL